jgi:hypothetical protein
MDIDDSSETHIIKTAISALSLSQLRPFLPLSIQQLLETPLSPPQPQKEENHKLTSKLGGTPSVIINPPSLARCE